MFEVLLLTAEQVRGDGEQGEESFYSCAKWGREVYLRLLCLAETSWNMSLA